ncbi:Plasmepsin-1 [Porphyridium purpureum]|uniref:Plasmepsin-1 n=1 Tax=Porphyridium purpureum TaxID=35688 RepID=A0A5J4Z2X9_PORPP|nr:Plasmepsin-1 [Porphyridium purpureum]|eukprot:POR5782..scf208_2
MACARRRKAPLALVCAALVLQVFLQRLVLSSGSSAVIKLPLVKRYAVHGGTHLGRLAMPESLMIRRLDGSHKAISIVSQLHGGFRLGVFYMQVEVDGLQVHVHVDTGSAALAVPFMQSSLSSTTESSVQCNADVCQGKTDRCRISSKCGGCGEFRGCCAKQNVSQCAFNVRYADGSSLDGHVLRGALKIGSLQAPVYYGGIQSQTTNFARENVTGIFGLAPADHVCYPNCHRAPFAEFVEQSKIDNVFAMCLAADGGVLSIGGLDRSMVNLREEPVHWIPYDTSADVFSIGRCNGIKVGDVIIDMSHTPTNRILVDSGTTLIVVPTSLWRPIEKAFTSKYCSVVNACNTTEKWLYPMGCYEQERSSFGGFPTLEFKLADGHVLKLEPEIYMVPVTLNGKKYTCFGVQAQDLGHSSIIFGNVLMQKYLTVFDRMTHKIGFGWPGHACRANNESTLTASKFP